MVRVLLVEDDIPLVAPLSRALSNEGFVVTHAADGLAALNKAKVEPPDLLLLDIGLPGLNGFGVCENLRSEGLNFPIIMMTACTDKSEVVHGLKVGADDYLIKPFSRLELLARIAAVFRRTINTDKDQLVIGKVTLDHKSRKCFVAGEQIVLTATEFRVLDYLMQKSGSMCRRSQIIKDVWATSWHGPSKNLDMHISSLRKKLGPGASQLQTVRGLGFRFDVE
jgi:DNA-binding response OmpR family regulator